MANPSRARAAKGSKLLRGNGASPEIFTLVGEIRSIDGPDGQTNLIEVTTLESTGKEYVVDVPDFGTITLQMNLDEDDTPQTGLENDYYTQAKRNFRLELSTPLQKTLAFSGYVTAFSYGARVGSQITADATIKITGGVTRL
jgi:hypothetical protein